ncbi:MAG: hypothetical protein ACI8WB_002027, partial [Phenylobacterium sp.]
MPKSISFVTRIAKLLRDNIVMSLPQLSQALNDRSR